MHGKVIVLPKN